MPYYETVFIARQDLSQKQVEDLTQSFCDLITKDGGKIHKTENWGLRTLAYKIKKNRKGHYVLIESDSQPAPVLEMERQMRLNEDILRYMTLREDALSEGPSIVMDKSGRDYDETNSKKEAA
ncbi:MAG: 30S ribosomal protein S6 [Alphaproteobacteria bacterium]|nr:30S ribosomal protein S6 [Alphaproteobacteria bacterium]